MTITSRLNLHLCDTLCSLEPFIYSYGEGKRFGLWHLGEYWLKCDCGILLARYCWGTGIIMKGIQVQGLSTPNWTVQQLMASRRWAHGLHQQPQEYPYSSHRLTLNTNVFWGNIYYSVVHRLQIVAPPFPAAPAPLWTTIIASCRWGMPSGVSGLLLLSL